MCKCFFFFLNTHVFKVYKSCISDFRRKMNEGKEKGGGKAESLKARNKRKQAELIIIGEAVKASSVLFCPQS